MSYSFTLRESSWKRGKPMTVPTILLNIFSSLSPLLSTTWGTELQILYRSLKEVDTTNYIFFKFIWLSALYQKPVVMGSAVPVPFNSRRIRTDRELTCIIHLNIFISHSLIFSSRISSFSNLCGGVFVNELLSSNRIDFVINISNSALFRYLVHLATK